VLAFTLKIEAASSSKTMYLFTKLHGVTSQKTSFSNLICGCVDRIKLHTSNLIIVKRNSIFWDTTPCSPLKVNRRFGGTCRLHLQSRKISRARHQRGSRRQNRRCLLPAYLLVLADFFLRPWKWRRYATPKRRLQLSRLHGVISQKMVLFITTAVRASNPIEWSIFFHYCYSQAFSISTYNSHQSYAVFKTIVEIFDRNIILHFSLLFLSICTCSFGVYIYKTNGNPSTVRHDVLWWMLPGESRK
jgi:hypothetical protein